MIRAMQRIRFEPWITLLVFLSMTILIKGVSTSSSRVAVIEGSNVTLNCTRDRPTAAYVIWNFHDILYPIEGSDRLMLVASIYHDGQFYTNIASAWANEIGHIGNSNLVINRLRLDRDDGYFTCTLGISTIVTIEVTVQVPVKTVSLVPTNSVTLSTEQTGTTTFTCKVTSKPRATVTWQRVKTDTSVVPLSGATETTYTHDKLIDVTSTLSYTPDKEHNGDSIRCTTSSPANTSPVYNETKLIIHYPPDSVRAISGYTGPVNESSTESMHLICSVNGAPNPNNTLNYTWSSDCETGAGSTSHISVPRNRAMNNKQCYCTVRHPETGWQRNSTSITFSIHYHPYSVNHISGYAGPMIESSSSVQLICNVNGGANPDTLTYSWSTDCGSGVRSEAQIIVSRNRNMNTKQCSCTVRHPETGWVGNSPAITFNFLYPPDSVRNIYGYTSPVTESSASMQLTCSVDGAHNPPNTLTYAWSSGCGTGARSTSQISVSQNRTMNNKQCYCTVTHPETGCQQDSASVTFNVYFGPDSVVIEDKTTVIGTSGTGISVMCTGSDSNPIASLNWYNTTGGSKTPLSPDVSGPPHNGTYGQIVQRVYRGMPSRYDDEQQITCEGQNPRVPDNKQSDYVILNISYPPLLEPAQTSIENKIVVENTQLILTCTAWAKPLADITWDPRPPTSSVNSADNNYRRISTFTLPAIKRTEIGLYRCSASNIHGDMQNQGFNVTVYNATPRVYIYEAIVQGKVASPVAISCDGMINQFVESMAMYRLSTQQKENTSINEQLSFWGRVAVLYADRYSVEVSRSPHGSSRALYRFTIRSLTDTDDGYYMCAIVRADGTSEIISAAMAEVIVLRLVQDLVLQIGNRRFYSDNVDENVISVDVFTPVTVTCSATGSYPAPDMQIRIGGVSATPRTQASNNMTVLGTFPNQARIHDYRMRLTLTSSDVEKDIECLASVNGLNQSVRVRSRVSIVPGDNSTSVCSCDDELLLIEKRRLAVDTLRLNVERERLAVEQGRLTLERERLAVEQGRLALERERLALERDRPCNP